MFTHDQIEEIKKKLIMLGTKDTQFPDAHKLNGEEIIAIVQDGENKKIPLSLIINDDFINVSKDTTEILTLSTAVSKIDINNRKLGQVITFKDSANSWAIRQFTGSSLDNWNDISLWKSISGIDELKSQVETNTEDISVLSDEIERHDASILNLNTGVSALQIKVDENTTSISQINNTIADHGESIAQINTKLEEHTESINAKITTDRIEDGAVTSEKIATSAFDGTLSVSRKIAPADVVGSKFTKLNDDITERYGSIVERSSFVYAIIDSEGKLLFGIKEDGSVYLCSIDDMSNKKFMETTKLIHDTDERLSDSISKTKIELNESKVNGISAESDAEKYVIGIKTQGGTTFINNLKIVTSEKVGLMSPTMLQNLLNNTANLQEIDTHIKIAEIDSKSVYPSDVTKIVDDYKYIYAVTDSNGRLLFGIKENGSFEWSKGIPNHLKDYIEKANVGDILPEGNSSAIQKSDYVLTHGILGINWKKTFVGSDNPLLGVNWMLDNLDISYFSTNLSVSEISQEDKMKVLNSCIKTMNENGIPVNISISSFPTWKGIEGEVSMEDYLRVVDEALSYDGNSDKVLMDGSTYKCKVSDITFLDELEFHVVHTPKELLELLDYLVSYAKGKRNDIIIHAPFSSNHRSLYHEIGSIRLTNGHCFSDLFDYYGIDIWAQDIDSNTKKILKAYSIADPINSYDKKMCALVGFSTLAYTQDEQAINYFKHTLKYLSYGADIFSPFCPEYIVGEYYILEPVLSNASHLYIRMGDNSNMSITDGDGYDDIILRFGAKSWAANATIIMNTVSVKPLKIADNLKNHGIWISGNTGLYVSKVSIVHNNGTEDIIWQGSVDVSSSPLIISKDSFSTITSTDKVVISTNAEVANGLNDIIPRKAAMCFKHLCKILHKGCTRPTIKMFGGTIIAMWNDDSNRPIYALWSESESNEIPVSIEGNYYITDIYGNVKDINDISSISEPIIIMNSTKIKLK